MTAVTIFEFATAAFCGWELVLVWMDGLWVGSGLVSSGFFLVLSPAGKGKASKQDGGGI
jgi:hypothetical protein